MIGRILCGLPVCSIDFSILPPHFKDGFQIPPDIVRLFPNHARFDSGFLKVVPFLVASLAYHRAWLMKTLDASHPLFTSALWTSNKLAEGQIIIAHGNSPEGALQATGVPLALVTALEVAKVKERLEELAINVKAITERNEAIKNGK